MTTRDGRGGIAVLALVGLFLAGWAVAVKSPLFGLREVRVQGNVRLSAADVEALAGVDGEANVLTLGLGRVAASVEADPWIRRATVERDLPDAIVIRVQERSPIGWVADPEGGVVVSGDGVALARRAEPRRLATIGHSPQPLDPGTQVSSVLRGAIDVVAALPPRVRRQVEAVDSGGPEVTARLRSGAEVMIGRSADLTEKAAALDSILRWAGEHEVALAYIDVRAPRTPAVKPVTSA